MSTKPFTAAPVVAFDPSDLITVEELANRLRPDLPLAKGVAWCREKVRRRTANAIPCFNLGKHLMFSWIAVSDWIRKSHDQFTLLTSVGRSSRLKETPPRKISGQPKTKFVNRKRPPRSAAIS